LSLSHSLPRELTRPVHVGGVQIGGGAPVVVQSMTCTDTADAQATLAQVCALAQAGCDIVRVSVPTEAALEGFRTICAESPVPIVADIHFNHKLAIGAVEAGAAKLRINPGNIGDWTKVDQAIHYMELEAFADRFIDEMSGGQRQRAFIAMVLAQDTEYVLLDEPTNNLDIYHATQMMKLVRRLCDELGKTVILVLHEINLAAFYSDVICAFKDGRIAAQGTVDEVMTPENLKRIYGVDFEIHRIDGKPLAIFH